MGQPAAPFQARVVSLEIRLRRLGIGSGKAALIENLQLDVPRGAIHTVMGPSGSGKSSLLAAVCGTLNAALAFEGSVLLNSLRIDNLPTRQRRVGLLFQDDLLFAHMTVRENLMFAVPAGPHRQREAAVDQALADLELPGFGQADPATLSSGQRARVALMRALLAEPQALLLDEPFSKLDAALRDRMRQFVFAVVRARQIPVLLVTHDAADIADTGRVTRL